MLHYWTGWTLVQIATHLGRSREAVAGLLGSPALLVMTP